MDLCLKQEKYLTIRTINFIQRENEIIFYPICTFFFQKFWKKTQLFLIKFLYKYLNNQNTLHFTSEAKQYKLISPVFRKKSKWSEFMLKTKKEYFFFSVEMEIAYKVWLL